MKVNIIGSGSIRGEHNSACYLIDDEIMIDYPNGASKYLYRANIKPSSINHILITHFHGDHFFDIPFYIFDKSCNKNKNTNIYCIKTGNRKIKKLGHLALQNSFYKRCIDTNLKFNNKNNFEINNYKIERLKVKHGNLTKANAYIFKDDKKIVGFTGDTKLCENIELMASTCNYLFCDCTHKDTNEAHMSIKDIKYLANKYKDCMFVASHLGENTRKIIKKEKIKNLIVAEDYLEILI